MRRRGVLLSSYCASSGLSKSLVLEGEVGHERAEHVARVVVGRVQHVGGMIEIAASAAAQPSCTAANTEHVRCTAATPVGCMVQSMSPMVHSRSACGLLQPAGCAAAAAAAAQLVKVDTVATEGYRYIMTENGKAATLTV